MKKCCNLRLVTYAKWVLVTFFNFFSMTVLIPAMHDNVYLRNIVLSLGWFCLQGSCRTLYFLWKDKNTLEEIDQLRQNQPGTESDKVDKEYKNIEFLFWTVLSLCTGAEAIIIWIVGYNFITHGGITKFSVIWCIELVFAASFLIFAYQELWTNVDVSQYSKMLKKKEKNK